MTTKSFFVRSEGPNTQSVQKAIEWLLGYPSTKGFLAVMGYGNLEGAISDVLGEGAVKSLIETGIIKLNNKEIRLVTERKLIYLGGDQPLVAFFPTADFLDKLQSIHNIAAMLVVPWTMKEVEPWIRTWNATEPGVQQGAKPPQLIQNKVVVEALKSLTVSVNVSTGITHPLDKETAIQTFMILRDAREVFNPDDVKAWLIRDGGWKATDAQEVSELAQKVLERRRLRKGSPHWRKDILKIWREEAR